VLKGNSLTDECQRAARSPHARPAQGFSSTLVRFHV
jgi:hypothetical protein